MTIALCTFKFDIPVPKGYEDETKKPVFKVYAYKSPFPVEEGDICVVMSSNGLGLVQVKQVLENTPENEEEIRKAFSWTISKVDFTEYLARETKRLALEETL